MKWTIVRAAPLNRTVTRLDKKTLPNANTRNIGHSVVDRYSAKLLFQFRVDVDGDPGKRRLCEERIVVIEAGTARSAVKKSQRRGVSAEHSYVNDEGNMVHFEFVGIMDLLLLGVECEDDVVWYGVRERLLPMERRDKLIPPETRTECNSQLQAQWRVATKCT